MIQKLKVQTPDPLLVSQYLKEIAKAFKVDWQDERNHKDAHPIDAYNTADFGLVSTPIPMGFPVPAYAPSNISVSRDEKSKCVDASPESTLRPGASMPSELQSISVPEFPVIPGPSAPSGDPDFDDLEKRFEALKKKK